MIRKGLTQCFNSIKNHQMPLLLVTLQSMHQDQQLNWVKKNNTEWNLKLMTDGRDNKCLKWRQEPRWRMNHRLLPCINHLYLRIETKDLLQWLMLSKEICHRKVIILWVNWMNRNLCNRRIITKGLWKITVETNTSTNGLTQLTEAWSHPLLSKLWDNKFPLVQHLQSRGSQWTFRSFRIQKAWIITPTVKHKTGDLWEKSIQAMSTPRNNSRTAFQNLLIRLKDRLPITKNFGRWRILLVKGLMVARTTAPCLWWKTILHLLCHLPNQDRRPREVSEALHLDIHL